MSKFQDLTGQRFGRLTVIKRVEDYVTPKGQHQTRWLCRCDCGTEKNIVSDSLRNGATTSCGCYRKEKVIERNKKYNDWFIDMNTNIAVGTDSKGNKFTIDAEDWARCKDYCWYVYKYISTYISGKNTYLHHFLINPPKDMFIDHINGDPTDNCKSNLRIVTKQQNQMNRKKQNNNSSGCTGVRWNKERNKWIASISYKKEYIYLGTFTNLEDAIKARQEAEVKYFGEYRRVGVLNE